MNKVVILVAMCLLATGAFGSDDSQLDVHVTPLSGELIQGNTNSFSVEIIGYGAETYGDVVVTLHATGPIKFQDSGTKTLELNFGNLKGQKDWTGFFNEPAKDTQTAIVVVDSPSQDESSAKVTAGIAYTFLNSRKTDSNIATSDDIRVFRVNRLEDYEACIQEKTNLMAEIQAHQVEFEECSTEKSALNDSLHDCLSKPDSPLSKPILPVGRAIQGDADSFQITSEHIIVAVIVLGCVLLIGYWAGAKKRQSTVEYMAR